MALDPWFVTGFCQSSGSFTFSRSGRNLSPIFSIKLRSSEASLLESIRAYFGEAGRIYQVRGAPSGAAYYRIHAREELERVIEHFDLHPLLGSKGASYQIWRTLVLLKRERFRKPARNEIESLARQLSELKSKGRRPS